jgi:hypothetical protein
MISREHEAAHGAAEKEQKSENDGGGFKHSRFIGSSRLRLEVREGSRQFEILTAEARRTRRADI